MHGGLLLERRRGGVLGVSVWQLLSRGRFLLPVRRNDLCAAGTIGLYVMLGDAVRLCSRPVLSGVSLHSGSYVHPHAVSEHNTYSGADSYPGLLQHVLQLMLEHVLEHMLQLVRLLQL